MTKSSKNGLRGQILRAARKLLIKDGIQNVSMRKIAAEIGCKAPSIYYHFRNKDQLIHTLIDEGHQRLFQFLTDLQAALPEGSPVLKKVETNIRGFIRFGFENPEFYEIMYLSYSEEIARYPKESFRKTQQTLELTATLYREAMEQGLVEEADPILVATTTGTMLNGFIATVLMHRMDTRFESETLQDDLVSRILKGMGAQVNVLESLATV